MTAVAVPAIPAPPFGAIEKARAGDGLGLVEVLRPGDRDRRAVGATVAELIVGAVVSTVNDWIALNDEDAAELSTFLARQ